MCRLWAVVSGGVGRLGRAFAALTVLCVVGLAGCGGAGGGLPPGVAVLAGARSVSEAMVAHWTPIESILAYEVLPKKPPPAGLVPDPPTFSRCITFLQLSDEKKTGRKTPPAPVPKTPVPAASVLKEECRQRYESTRTHIIDFLITYQWLEQEAAEKGWKVTDAEAIQDMQRHIQPQFGGQAGFVRYLRWTGLNKADEILRFKNNLLANQFIEHVLFAKGQSASQHAAAYKRFLKKWIPRTHCRPGYVVPNCAEYKGPLKPNT